MIDTFDFIKELEKTGLKEESANLIAKKLVGIQDQTSLMVKENIAALAKKNELEIIRESSKKDREDISIEARAIERDLISKIDGVEDRLNARIDGVENRVNARIDGVEQEIKIVEASIVNKLTKTIGMFIGIATTILSILITTFGAIAVFYH
jgi:hypothetical protein